MDYQSIMIAKPILKRDWRPDERIQDLLRPNLTWEEKVLKVLHAIRCREFTEYNPKLKYSVPTRFCLYNIAFFDLDKESELKHGSLFCKIPPSKYYLLDGSINVMSIKVVESDVSFPINIYGTVLVRDQYDFKCVYLFNRDKNNPQQMVCLADMLSLTGPNRAIAGSDNMYFEFNLKIKVEGADDQDFCKGLVIRVAYCDNDRRPYTLSLESCLSTVKMVYTPVWSALEASLGVSILNGESSFSGNITACTTNFPGCDIVLYDSEVAGTDTKLGKDGSVMLTCRIVSVSWNERLTLKFSIEVGDHGTRTAFLLLKNDVEQHAFTLGPYEMQVRITWTGLLQECPDPWDEIRDIRVLR